ncbi:MAG: hypothetical protein H6679_03115 [Epsilonproteobacteria bacterium]|nr:hypothetical protein [Campylobacterota bacterium]
MKRFMGNMAFVTVLFTGAVYAIEQESTLFKINNQSQTKMFSDGTIEAAYSNYSHLKNSNYFEAEFITQHQHVRDSVCQKYDVEIITADCQSNDLECLYLKRKSNTLLVIGPGFPVPKERMISFVDLFPNYDLLFFDYRGQGGSVYKDSSWFSLAAWLGFGTKCLFGVDMAATKLGQQEHDDLYAVVEAVKQKKQYQHTYGIALCYSSYIFAKAQALKPNLFQKLILDGCWPNVASVVRKIAQYPSLVCGRQPPGSPCSWLTDAQWFQDIGQWIVESTSGADLGKFVELSEYAKHLNIPVLFWQCGDDCYCSAEQFEKIWQATKAWKMSIFTKNRHGRNHVWQRELYAYLGNYFFENALNEALFQDL